MHRLLLLFALLFALPAAAAVPKVVGTEGVLTSKTGAPLANGTYALTFRLYASASGGAPIWQESASVTVSNGRFAWDLGSAVPLSAQMAGEAQWIGVQVGTEPELPRVQWRSSPFALRAQVAEGLECNGCVQLTMLAPDVLAPYALLSDLDAYVKAANLDALLAAYVKLSDLASTLAGLAKLSDLAVVATSGKYADLIGLPDLTQFATWTALAKVATTGQYADLAGLPTLAKVGTACAVGQVVTGIAADGSLVCGAGGGGSSTLSGISNGLLDNVFDLTYASTTTPLAIPDNNPGGISSEIDVPDVGTVKAITVSVNVATQDLTALTLTLYDPAGNGFVLYNKGQSGTSLTATYPTPNAVVSGDLSGTWVGQNAKGAWFLVAKDSKAGGTVGSLVSWSVNVKVLSSQAVAATGNLAVNGALTVGGKAVPQVWTAQSDALTPEGSLILDTQTGSESLSATAWYYTGIDWVPVTGASQAQCLDCGDGSDGDFAPSAGTTTTISGDKNFRSFFIPATATVQVMGLSTIRVQTTARIDGVLSALPMLGDGQGNGANGGCAGGGGGGSYGTIGAAGGAGAAAGATFGSAPLVVLAAGGAGGTGGTGKCGGTATKGGFGGLGGGGFRLLATFVDGSGVLAANGAQGGWGVGPCTPCGTESMGGGGSGGSIWITAYALRFDGQVTALGGSGGNWESGGSGPVNSAGGQGGKGRIRLDAVVAKPLQADPPAVEGLINVLMVPAFLVSQPAPGVVRLTNKGGVSAKVRLVVVR